MMTKRLLLGSGNADKRRELQTLLLNSGWEVLSLSDFREIPEPVEDGDTFEGNALLKARYYSEQFELPCVADDSGIEVRALDGAPGVYSARYAGESCSYEDNNRKLLKELERLNAEDRAARFVCCAAFVDPVTGESFTETRVCAGSVATAPKGENGFGYDPLFIPDGENQTFGEISPERKHAISHRGQAFRALSERLRSMVEGPN